MKDQLQTTNTGVSVAKQTGNGQIQKAINSPLVNQVGPGVIFAELNKAIGKSYVDTGYKAPNANNQNEQGLYNMMVSELTTYVKTRLSGLRVNELSVAIERGSVGEYGEFMGLSKKTFVMFLNAYAKDQNRLQVIADNEKLNQAPPVIPTPDQQFNLAKSNVQAAFEAHISGRYLGTVGSLAYNFLNGLGLITYSKEVKNEIFEHAKQKLIAEKKGGQLTSDFFIRKAISLQIDNLIAGPVDGTKEHSLIVSKAKEITAARYFNDIKLSGTDLMQLVEEKRSLFIANSTNE